MAFPAVLQDANSFGDCGRPRALAVVGGKTATLLAYVLCKFRANYALMNKEGFLLTTANIASCQNHCLRYFRPKMYVVGTGKLFKATAKMAFVVWSCGILVVLFNSLGENKIFM